MSNIGSGTSLDILLAQDNRSCKVLNAKLVLSDIQKRIEECDKTVEQCSRYNEKLNKEMKKISESTDEWSFNSDPVQDAIKEYYAKFGKPSSS